MVKIASVLLLATTVLGRAVIQRRDLNETLTNLEAIDTATNNLKTIVTNWDGSVLGALGINSASTNLGNQIDAANADAQDEPVADSADSQTIIAYISGTGEPDIAASLNALVTREPDFAADGITSLVLSSLQSLKSKNDAYGATLLNLTSADQKANAQAVLTKIDTDFNTAIAAFS